jgi:hypothetical protein
MSFRRGLRDLSPAWRCDTRSVESRPFSVGALPEKGGFLSFQPTGVRAEKSSAPQMLPHIASGLRRENADVVPAIVSLFRIIASRSGNTRNPGLQRGRIGRSLPVAGVRRCRRRSLSETYLSPQEQIRKPALLFIWPYGSPTGTEIGRLFYYYFRFTAPRKIVRLA